MRGSSHKSNCEDKFSNEYWVLSVAVNFKKIQYAILLKSTFVKHYCVDVYIYLLKQPFLSNCMSRFQKQSRQFKYIPFPNLVKSVLNH